MFIRSNTGDLINVDVIKVVRPGDKGNYDVLVQGGSRHVCYEINEECLTRRLMPANGEIAIFRLEEDGLAYAPIIAWDANSSRPVTSIVLRVVGSGTGSRTEVDAVLMPSGMVIDADGTMHETLDAYMTALGASK